MFTITLHKSTDTQFIAKIVQAIQSCRTLKEYTCNIKIIISLSKLVIDHMIFTDNYC